MANVGVDEVADFSAAAEDVDDTSALAVVVGEALDVEEVEGVVEETEIVTLNNVRGHVLVSTGVRSRLKVRGAHAGLGGLRL